MNGEVCLAFSDTGKKIFLQDANGAATILNASTGEKEAALEDVGFQATSATFSADEKSVSVQRPVNVNGTTVYRLAVLEAIGTDLSICSLIDCGVCITADEAHAFCWDSDNALFLVPKYDKAGLRQLAKEHLAYYQTRKSANAVTPTVTRVSSGDEPDIVGHWNLSGEYNENGDVSSDALTQAIENQSVWVTFNSNHAASFKFWNKLVQGTWELEEKVGQSEGSSIYYHAIVFDSGGSAFSLYYVDDTESIMMPSLLGDGNAMILTKQ